MELTRRSFITKTVQGAAVISILPYLASCGNFIRGDLERKETSSKLKSFLGEDKYEILRLASLAPSGHNTQPWRIKIINPEKWILAVDKSRQLPAVDPHNRELILSLGTFLQNLEYAAISKNYTAEVDVVAVTNFDEEIAEINLIKTGGADYNSTRITERRTIKSGHESGKISSDDFNYIADGERNICLIDKDSEEGKFISDATLKANEMQASRDEAMKELSEWMRFSNKEARRHMDGLTTSSMEITGAAGLFVRTFFDQETVMKESFRKKSVENVKEYLSSFGSWIVISSDSSSTEEILSAGRRFERIALRAKDKNIAVHPVSQALEEGDFKSQIESMLGLSNVQFLLRASYVEDYPVPVSLRRPVEWFTELS